MTNQQRQAADRVLLGLWLEKLSTMRTWPKAFTDNDILIYLTGRGFSWNGSAWEALELK
ncbi:MAG TPA: hypothetical protein PLC98_03660 [Anaerolineales bacterium]|nr:hypothetical protein [Anaerolineales bacterium]